MRLRGEPRGNTDGVRVLGLLGCDHPALGYAPQQGGVGLVGHEELATASTPREHGLSGATVRGTVCLPYGELRVPDQLGQQAADHLAVVRGGMPGGPGVREACSNVLGGWGLVVTGAEGEGVHGGLNGGEPWMPRAGEQGGVHGLVPSEVGQVPYAQEFREAQDDFEPGSLQPASLDGLDP